MKKIIKKAQKQDKILGINITSSSKEEVLSSVKDKLSDSRSFYIVTPNPELVLMAQDNIDLKNALNSADFAIPDGTGLKLAIPNLHIIKGRELFLDLIELANKNKWKVFLLGGLGNEAELACKHLISLYPNIFISFDNGPVLNQKAELESQVDAKSYKDAVDRINKFNPDLLFVAFGNPKQEIWIHKNLNKLKVGGAMAVGGSFRYVAGLSKLPPKWVQRLGLEWFWRLITEPMRLKRILNAVVIFPLRLFLYKTKILN